MSKMATVSRKVVICLCIKFVDSVREKKEKEGQVGSMVICRNWHFFSVFQDGLIMLKGEGK